MSQRESRNRTAMRIRFVPNAGKIRLFRDCRHRLLMEMPLGTTGEDAQRYLQVLFAKSLTCGQTTEATLMEQMQGFCQQLNRSVPLLQWTDNPHYWGQCDWNKRVIRLNRRLLQLPQALTAEVLAHELCHFEHPVHNEAFWRQLASLVPDWAACEAALELAKRQEDT